MATIEKKLTGHPAAQCKVIMNNDLIVFISYKTVVITAEKYDNGYIIRCSGLYSRTTRTQIGLFLKEYFNKVSFYDIKRISGTENAIYIDKYGYILAIEGDK